MATLLCRVTFQDNAPVVLKNKEDTLKTGKTQQYNVALDTHSGLKFFIPGDKPEEFGSLNPFKMAVDFDKNGCVMSFYNKNEHEACLELKSTFEILTKIDRFITSKGKPNYKGPLCYTPSNKNRETIFTIGGGETNVNLRGFLNLAILTLVFAKFRDILKNFLEYGMILRASIEVSINPTDLAYYIGSSMFPVLIVWWFEKQGLKNRISKKIVDYVEWWAFFLLLSVPIVVCNIVKPRPMIGFGYVGLCIGNLLKLHSYSDVMHHLRRVAPRVVKLEAEKKDVIAEIGEADISRENLEIILKHKNDLSGLANINDLFYFLTVPTFCYQLWYPRTPKVRWTFVGKRVFEAVLCWALFAFILNQYIMPIMDEAIDILENGTLVQIAERVIRLSFPVCVCWILFFFGTFQFVFNIQAELQRFGDRQFYKDWWNCRDLNEYWRLWNLPIHEFLSRHVYFPLLRKGYSKTAAKLVVFFISAVGHEYWASVPLRLFALWAFLSMFLQLPIMIIEQKLDKILKGSQLGNIFFWISFCFVGQPMALLLYYQLYLAKHGHEFQ